MASRCGSPSRTRSLLSTARSSSLPRLRPSLPRQSPSSRPAIPRMIMEALRCTQLLMPLHGGLTDARLTSHVLAEARACCELSQGTFSINRTCQAR